MDEEEVVVTPDEQTPDENPEVVEESEVEETPAAPDEGQAEDEFDPDSYVDSLELSDDKKKVLKESLMRHGDYTKKTQALAQERSLVQKWSPVLNKLVSDQKLFDLVMGYGGNQDTPEAKDEIPQDPREYAEYVKNQTIREMQQTMAVERDLEQASNLDPRLTSQEPQNVNFQKIIAAIVAQDSDVLQGRKSYTQGVTDALAWYDNDFYTGVAKGVQTTMNQKVQEKRMVTPKGSSPISTKTSSKPTTIMDSYKESLRELGLE